MPPKLARVIAPSGMGCLKNTTNFNDFHLLHLFCWFTNICHSILRCEQRGCCWHPVAVTSAASPPHIPVPSCFFPLGYDTYSVQGKVKTTGYGFTATLQRHNHSPWSNDVMILKLDIFLETQDRIRIKVNGSSVAGMG